MKYNQPYGVSDPNAPYINGNPSTGTMGSIPPAASIEYPQREIVNLISHAGLVAPDNADLNQLAKSVQSLWMNSQDDAGTANAYQVTMHPAPTAYFKYLTIITMIANTNTGPSVLNVNALGPKPIVRVDGSPLNPGDLTAGTIVCFIYDGTKFQIVWQSFSKGSQGGVLTQNATIYVNVATGDDALYDGSTAAVVAGTNHGPFKTIQHGIDTAFLFTPSAAFSVTIQIADGTYPEHTQTPVIPGPRLIFNGNASAPSNVHINSPGGNCITVSGPNSAVIQNLKFSQTASPNSACISANGSGASIQTINTVSGGCLGWCFLGNGNGSIQVGSHSFTGNTAFPFAAYRAGTCTLGAGSVFSIAGGGIAVTAFAQVVSGGQIEVQATAVPTFTGGAVTGAKYNGILNGVINTQGQGASYFPGSSAGTLASGAQYG